MTFLVPGFLVYFRMTLIYRELMTVLNIYNFQTDMKIIEKHLRIIERKVIQLEFENLTQTDVNS